MNAGTDVDTLRCFLKFLYNNFYRVGDFLLIIEQYFLTNDFRYKKALRLVGKRILIKIGGRLGSEFQNALVKLVYIEFVQCQDRKSTRLNSSHVRISYAVFCLKKKKKI